jgi:hypothetical protein
MQPVEHRQGRQGNPDASRCLRRPRTPSSPQARCGGAGCASAVIVPHGPCVRHGCVGNVAPPHAARYRAPGSNSLVCSSAELDRSGCKAGLGQSTVRTGTSGRNRPYATSGPKPKVLDGRVPARHTVVAPPSSARCRVGRRSASCQAMDRRRARLTSASSCVVQRTARHPSQARQAAARSKRMSAPSVHPLYRDAQPPPAGSSRARPSPVWPPSGRPYRRRTHRRSSAITKPSLEPPLNAKPRPHRRISAVPDRRSQEPLPDVECPRARSAQICRRSGVACAFQVSANVIEPSESSSTGNLLAKDAWRATLADEVEERRP